LYLLFASRTSSIASTIIMNTDELLAALNEEIARLEEARRLLSGDSTRGKPRRTVSVVARKRMAEAQRKRWAARGEKGAKG
jgi:hypothetical protein